MDNIEKFDLDGYLDGVVECHNIWVNNLMKIIDEIVEEQRIIEQNNINM